jgi:hypothetical protein
MLPLKAIDEWLKSLLAPNWEGAWTDEERTHAFFNLRNFLRSLYIRLTTDGDIPKEDGLSYQVLKIIHELKPF